MFTQPESEPCELLESFPSLSLLLGSEHRKHLWQVPSFPTQVTLMTPFKMQMQRVFLETPFAAFPSSRCICVGLLIVRQSRAFVGTLKARSEPGRAPRDHPCVPKKAHRTELSHAASAVPSNSSFVNCSAGEGLRNSRDSAKITEMLIQTRRDGAWRSLG